MFDDSLAGFQHKKDRKRRKSWTALRGEVPRRTRVLIILWLYGLHISGVFPEVEC